MPRDDRPPDIARWISRAARRAERDLRKLDDDTVRRIHRLRTSMKKIRSAARLARGLVQENARKTVLEKAGFIKDAFAEDRDAHVVRATVAKFLGPDAPARLGLLCGQGDPAAAGPPPRAVGEAVAAAGELVAAIETAGFADLSLPGLKRAFAVSLDRCHEAGQVALASTDDDSWHRWRMRAKDIWYQAAALESDWKRAKKFIAPAKRLGAVLGVEHDIAVAIERVPALTDSDLSVLGRARAGLRAKAKRVARDV